MLSDLLCQKSPMVSDFSVWKSATVSHFLVQEGISVFEDSLYSCRLRGIVDLQYLIGKAGKRNVFRFLPMLGQVVSLCCFVLHGFVQIFRRQKYINFNKMYSLMFFIVS